MLHQPFSLDIQCLFSIFTNKIIISEENAQDYPNEVIEFVEFLKQVRSGYDVSFFNIRSFLLQFIDTAAGYGNYEMFQYILKTGIELCYCDSESELRTAVSGGNFKIVEYILKKRKDITTNQMCISLWHSVENGYLDAARVLLHYGAQFKYIYQDFEKILKREDYGALIFLLCYDIKPNAGCWQYCPENLEIFKLLVDMKISFPLSVLESNNSIEFCINACEILIDSGYNFTYGDMCRLIANDNFEVFQYLLRKYHNSIELFYDIQDKTASILVQASSKSSDKYVIEILKTIPPEKTILSLYQSYFSAAGYGAIRNLKHLIRFEYKYTGRFDFKNRIHICKMYLKFVELAKIFFYIAEQECKKIMRK